MSSLSQQEAHRELGHLVFIANSSHSELFFLCLPKEGLF